jgi:hypothetical protein
LLIPRALIFESSVWRGIPSLAAAPNRPEILPLDSAKAASIISLSRSRRTRSCSASEPGTGTVGPVGCCDSRFSQVSSTENVSPSLRITARSTTFCSSRSHQIRIPAAENRRDRDLVIRSRERSFVSKEELIKRIRKQRSNKRYWICGAALSSDSRQDQ